MRRIVVDASVMGKWFADQGEVDFERALDLRRQYEEQQITVLAPHLLFQELLNIASRKWRWSDDRLHSFATFLEEAMFKIDEPSISRIAGWTIRGLTSYDASYVALAEEYGVELVTADDEIVAVAPGIAIPLASY